MEQLKGTLKSMGERAGTAAAGLAVLDTATKNSALIAMAEAIEENAEKLRVANTKDIDAGRENGLSNAMLDRLEINEKRIRSMASGLVQVASLDDPVGRLLDSWTRPNGLRIEKVSVPIGVIGIVYESRPNVTADAAGLCLKAGNAVILRGGKEAIHSNLAIAECLREAGTRAGLPEASIQLIETTDRDAVSIMLKMDEYIDLIIPRGGEGLIRAVVENSTIPVIKHYKGVCHIYVDSEYDSDMALRIVENAKCQRPGVCNAVETLLINEKAAAKFAPVIAEILTAKGVELRGDESFLRYFPSAKPASEDDWREEFLDLVLAVRIVKDVDAAISHINTYGSAHSDAIISRDPENVKKFLNQVDSSTVYANASTRFTDGGEFGMGAEIGISTDKLHARGPMGLPELNTYKYLVHGTGQIRE